VRASTLDPSALWRHYFFLQTVGGRPEKGKMPTAVSRKETKSPVRPSRKEIRKQESIGSKTYN
jgi:hypothetical protein